MAYFFDRYKVNLRMIGDKLISYNTEVAIIDRVNRRLIIQAPYYWSQTTSKHINYASSELGFKITNGLETNLRKN